MLDFLKMRIILKFRNAALAATQIHHKGTKDTKRNMKFHALGELCVFVV
jgi:hypothetical protein